jgi:hypothetical protein
LFFRPSAHFSGGFAETEEQFAHLRPEWGEFYAMVMLDGHPQIAGGCWMSLILRHAVQVYCTDQRWAD